MRATIEELRGMHDKLREAIAEARRDATAAGGIGEVERETTKKLLGRRCSASWTIEKRAMRAPRRQRSRAGRPDGRSS